MLEGAIILVIGILIGFIVGYEYKKPDLFIEKSKGFFAKKAEIVETTDPLDTVDI